MTVNCSRRARVGIASVVVALVGGLGAACTAEPPRTAESDALSERVSEWAASPNEANSRAPVALVLFSGRIAYPHITLTTWDTCPFVIERVERVRVGVLRVFGQESSTACSRHAKRHTVSKRLPIRLKAGSDFEKKVIVVSEHPEYEVEAVVRRAIA